MHPVILGKPFITASTIETKVLNSRVAFAWIQNQTGENSVQFLMVPSNHDRNKRELYLDQVQIFKTNCYRVGR